ncbi:MAG: DUF4214 domain-containing protein [Pseudomonadota bacterium]
MNEVEPNGSSATATAATLGMASIGRLSTGSDIDYYKVQLTGAGLLSLALDVPRDGTYNTFQLDLYGSAGNRLGTFDTGADKTFQVPVGSAGTYYVGVSATNYYFSYYDANPYTLTMTLGALPATGFEAEANGSMATATPMALATPTSGIVIDSADQDFYKLVVPAAGVLALGVDVAGGSILDYFKFEVYNSGGSLQASYTTGADASYHLALAEAGTYYLRVAASTFYGYDYASTNPYTVTASLAPGASSAYEIESNNTISTATPLALAASIEGQVLNHSDVDFYKMQVTAAGMVSVALDAPTDQTYSYYKISLYDASGMPLGTMSAGGDQTLKTQVAVAGTYYVSIGAGDQFDVSAQARNPYGLQVSQQPGLVPGYETESNNTIATANTLALSSAIVGQLSAGSDHDFYKIAVPGQGLLNLMLDVPTSNTSDYFQLGLYSESGGLLSSFVTGRDQLFHAPVPQAGNYYVAVNPGSAFSFDTLALNAYSLTVGIDLGVPTGYESEPNNTMQTAGALAFGQAVTGQVSSSLDVDFFKLKASSAGLLSLGLDLPSSDDYASHFQIGIYGSTGSLLAMLTAGTDKVFQTMLPAAGDYFVGIAAGVRYAADTVDSAQYSLNAGFVAGPAAGFELESNNSMATANALALSTPILGQLVSSLDSDYFKVSTTTSGSLELLLQLPLSPYGSTEYKLGVYSISGALLGSFSSSKDQLLSVQAPVTGDYFVAVSVGTYFNIEQLRANTGQYNLTVNSVAAVNPPADVTAPTVLRFAPADEADNAGVGDNIVLTFGEAIQRGAGNIVLKSAAGATVASFDAGSSNLISISGNSLTINPSADLAYGTVYQLLLPAGSFKDLAGNPYAGSESYNFTTAVYPNHAGTGTVAWSGIAAQNQILSASNTLGDVDGLGVISYQWKANGSALAGETNSKLTLGEAQVGKVITVTASYTDGHNTAESFTSAASTPVLNVNDGGELLLIGNAGAGQTLLTALTDADGVGKASYRWQSSSDGSNWSDIAGATDLALTLGHAQDGLQIRAVASYLDGHGSAEQLVSLGSASARDDHIVGTDRADQISGGAGNDWLKGGAGNDRIDGGTGVDSAVFDGARSSYTVSQTPNGIQVLDLLGGDGVDLLVGVERLLFAGTGWALDTDANGNAGKAYRLYQAAFNRAPDAAGIGFWMSVLDHGAGASTVAAGFVGSDEYRAMYAGSQSNIELVGRYYEHILGRSADQAGLDFWAGALDKKVATVAEVLALISESTENIDHLGVVIGQGFAYIPFG